MNKWNTTFSAKNRVYLGVLIIPLAMAMLIAFKPGNPKMRQPMNVGSVQPLSKPFQLKKSMLSAKKSAERLDQQAQELMKVSYLNGWSRWRANIDIDSMEEQYSRDVVSHLKAMTKLMKFRREAGGLKKLQEFDFQNMVRKSDYLMGLSATKSSLQSLGSKSQDKNYLQAVLDNYNHERMIFDAKRIVIADN